jgi:voltage-gated potassium channel
MRYKNFKTDAILVLSAFFGVLLAGTFGYMFFEHWNFIDALYMSVITLTTVGYEEVHVLSQAGRIFTMILIIGGIGIVAYAFSTLAAIFIGGHLTDSFRRRKMQKKIDELKDHFIICGASHTGMSIAEEMLKAERHFVVIDSNPKEIEELIEKNILAIEDDATDDEVLIQAGIERAKGIFGCLAEDKDNAFLTLAAKILNPRIRVIIAQRDEEMRGKLLRSGADSVISPGYIGGIRMVSEMIRPTTVGFLDSMLRDRGGNYSFEDILVPDNVSEDLKIKDLKDSDKQRALIVAIKNATKNSYEINPLPDRKISSGELLVALGTPEQLYKLKTSLK